MGQWGPPLLFFSWTYVEMMNHPFSIPFQLFSVDRRLTMVGPGVCRHWRGAFSFLWHEKWKFIVGPLRMEQTQNWGSFGAFHHLLDMFFSYRQSGQGEREEGFGYFRAATFSFYFPKLCSFFPHLVGWSVTVFCA